MTTAPKANEKRKFPRIASMDADDQITLAKGADAIIADRQADRLAAELDAVRSLRLARKSRRTRKPRTAQKLADRSASSYRVTIEPAESDVPPICSVLSALRSLPGTQTSLTLARYGRLDLRRLGGPIPAELLAIISAAAWTVKAFMESYSLHRCCDGCRPTIAADRRFAVRCSACLQPLRKARRRPQNQ